MSDFASHVAAVEVSAHIREEFLSPQYTEGETLFVGKANRRQAPLM